MKTIALGMAGFLLLAACHSSRELETVERVNLDSYEGVWYDIAHLPRETQEDCRCSTAEYRKKEDHVEVINSCVDAEEGELAVVEGKAFPLEGSANSKMKVQFYWPFKGDYYIIALEDDYSYAMVGTPDRESLWILSREPAPAALIMKKYLNRAEELGFDTSELVYTDQSCHLEPMPQSR